ncbi:MAG TPA: STAS domain-containing protein [Catenuloplanes sp.]|jgi:anti-sigma B factor antagonist
MDEMVRVGSAADGTLDVALFGDIDYTNSPALTRLVNDAVTRRRPPVVKVDISAVTFLDSSGLGVLVVAYRAAAAIGAGYQVTGPRRGVYEQLRMAGLVDLFGIDAPPATVS